MVTSTRIDIPLQPPISSWSAPAAAVEGPSFQDMFMQAIRQTSNEQNNAQDLIARSVTGGDVTMVEANVAVAKADIALRMMMQVRNKILDAYNEIKQMQF